jgi:hypothetical protein
MVEATPTLSEALERAKAASEDSMTYIMKGYGFNVGNDFARADRDIPIEIAGSDARTVYGYIAGNPQSTLGFMRTPRIFVRVDRSCIATAQSRHEQRT